MTVPVSYKNGGQTLAPAGTRPFGWPRVMAFRRQRGKSGGQNSYAKDEKMGDEKEIGNEF